jgi:broad specificity phosphatase PhoE
VVFLIRHGESKWNEAQAKINITGMLDRDHALTELGIAQAEELNKRWKKERTERVGKKADVEVAATTCSETAGRVRRSPAVLVSAHVTKWASFFLFQIYWG